jgi:hypothetical protein
MFLKMEQEVPMILQKILMEAELQFTIKLNLHLMVIK